jgi:hypothetical protein
MLLDKIDMRFLNGLGHDLQAKLVADFGHDFPALITQALKRVRRSPRFPNASAEEARTTALDRFCHGERLLPTLDRTRPGDNRELVVADRRVSHADDRFLRP